MKNFFALLAITSFLAFTGCSSNITNLKEQFHPTYHDIIVEAGQEAAYSAALYALKQMGYAVTSSGAAQKKIEAMSNISSAEMNRPARQYTASVRFGVAPNNGTTVQVLFTEIREEMNNRREGMGTKQPLADSPLYGIFAKYVNQALVK